MANELHILSNAGGTHYAVLRRVSDAKVWNGTTFVTWVDADIANYDIPLTLQGGDLYAANMPSAVGAGTYVAAYYKQAGATPAITDTRLVSPDGAFYWNGTSTSTPPVGSVTVWGTRAGVEQKVGVINLREYANLEGVDPLTEPGLTNIAAAITDDLVEAATDMAVAWREYTATALGFETAVEERWLADTNEYGAAAKAWAGRNVEAGRTDAVPQQVATALDEWERRLEMLRTGAALLDYQEEEEIGDPDSFVDDDAPIGVYPTVDQHGRTINEPPPYGMYWDPVAGAFRWN